MPAVNVVIKPFSTSNVACALEWGHIVDGEFQRGGSSVRQQRKIMEFGERRVEGVYGKASYTEHYTFNFPENFALAIAAKKRTGVGTSKIEYVYEVLFAPKKAQASKGGRPQELEEAVLVQVEMERSMREELDMAATKLSELSGAKISRNELIRQLLRKGLEE